MLLLPLLLFLLLLPTLLLSLLLLLQSLSLLPLPAVPFGALSRPAELTLWPSLGALALPGALAGLLLHACQALHH